MRSYRFNAFGLENLRLGNSTPSGPGPGQVLLDTRHLSLNYRDLMVVTGRYNPHLDLPATPLSDAAGVISAVGAGVTRVRVNDQVMTHFVAGWIEGPFRQEYVATTLGTPGPGVAAEQVVLPEQAVVPVPEGLGLAAAATLPIAALTAWSALRTVYQVRPGETVLTLGTGGVSIFALQLAKAMGARVIITSSSDDKLERCRKLGADHTVNYRTTPAWEQAVLEYTGGVGVDLTVETVGPGTLDRSMKATRAGGTIALLGALTGRAGHVTTGLILMKRLHIGGIMVDSRAAFEALCAFLSEHRIEPVIGRRFAFEQLPEAFRCMQAGEHFGKIVIDMPGA
jgi:NADPH:quinone reductase-like Zn-dependent oxidoreductase